MQAYLKIFLIGTANQLEYRVNFISSFLFSLAPFGVNTLLWLAAARGSEGIPLGTEGIVTYYFVTLIVSNITSTTAVFKVSDDIRLGNLSRDLLKPYNYAICQLMLDLPQRVIFIVMNVLPLAILYLTLRKHLTLNLSLPKAALFAAFLSAGYLINFLIDFLIGLYSFYFSRVSSLYTSIKVLRNISAGTIFPLMVLPDAFLGFLSALPFAHTSYIPTLFVMDAVPLDTALAGLAQAIGWIALLSAACTVLWKRGIRRHSAYGG